MNILFYKDEIIKFSSFHEKYKLKNDNMTESELQRFYNYPV